MRAKIRTERAANKALDFLAKLGIEVDATEMTATAEMLDSSPENRELQGEAALLFLLSPEKFIQKWCKRKECGLPYAATYRSVAYCSNACRGLEFYEQTGMKIDWSKPATERWGGQPPLIVDPETFGNIIRLMEEWKRGRNQDSPQSNPKPASVPQQLVASPSTSSPPQTNPHDEPDLDDILQSLLG